MMNNDKQRLTKIIKDNKKVTYHLEMKSNPELGQINFRTCDLVDEILVRLLDVIPYLNKIQCASAIWQE